MHRRTRTGSTLALGILVGSVLTTGLVPALGAAGGEIPDVVFLARSDVAADALAAGPVAGQLGAPLLLTRPTTLSDAARDALQDLRPDLLVVLGGEVAVSAAVMSAAEEACGCSARRVMGAGREDTAAAVTALLSEYGLRGPLVAGATRAGDAALTGTFGAGKVETDALAVHGAIHLGSNTIRLPLDGSPQENGAAVRAAVAALASTSPAVLELGPGTAHLGSTPLDLHDGLTLVGSGRDATTLTADPAATDDQAGMLRVPATIDEADPPVRVTVSDLTVDVVTDRAGHLYAGTVGPDSSLTLEDAHVRVRATGTATFTGGFRGAQTANPGGFTGTSTISIRRSTVEIDGGNGSTGVVHGGDIVVEHADLTSRKPDDPPVLAGTRVTVEGSSVSYADTSIDAEVSAEVVTSQTQDVRAPGIRVRHSTVLALDAWSELHVSASTVSDIARFPTRRSCLGVFGRNNDLLTVSCANP